MDESQPGFTLHGLSRWTHCWSYALCAGLPSHPQNEPAETHSLKELRVETVWDDRCWQKRGKKTPNNKPNSFQLLELEAREFPRTEGRRSWCQQPRRSRDLLWSQATQPRKGGAGFSIDGETHIPGRGGIWAERAHPTTAQGEGSNNPRPSPAPWQQRGTRHSPSP